MELPSDDGTTSGERPPVRARGLLVMSALVVLGVGVTAGYLQLAGPEVGEIIASRKREIAAAPRSPEGRLAQWLVFGGPQIHHRLERMRFSADEPWLVTHAIGRSATTGGTVEIHGIDLAAMPLEIARIDGSTVRVRLPLPGKLGVGPLRGEHALSVPIAASPELAPDPVGRAVFLVRFALDGLAQALERDIEGAELVIEIGPGETWESVLVPRTDGG